MGLNWALSSLGAPAMELDELIALAERFEINLLELRTLGGTLDIPAYLMRYFQDHPEQFETVKQSGKIYSLDTSFGLTHHDESQRQALQAFATWAKRLDVRYLRVFGGFPFEEPLTDDRLKTATNNLNWWQSLRDKDASLPELALEVHDGFSSARRCVQLMKYAGRELPIVWDAHHSYVTAKESFTQAWEMLGACVCTVHVKDSGLDATGKREERLPGQGDVPMLDLLRLLTDAGFNGPVALEWEKQWHPEIPELHEALEAMTKAGWRVY